MAEIGNRAVVLGGSMAGLLAARVLSEFYRSVTLVDRDVLPAVGSIDAECPRVDTCTPCWRVARSFSTNCFPACGPNWSSTARCWVT